MSDTKRCLTCKQTKPKTPTHFYVDKRLRDGFSSSCQECMRARSRKWTRDNQEKVSEKVRAWRTDHADRSKDHAAQRQERLKREQPLKVLARRKVASALKAGTLQKGTQCAACNVSDAALHAHHPNYKEPLQVEWLCAACHRSHHTKAGRRRASS